jgi:hypothetical protein
VLSWWTYLETGGLERGNFLRTAGLHDDVDVIQLHARHLRCGLRHQGAARETGPANYRLGHIPRKLALGQQSQLRS